MRSILIDIQQRPKTGRPVREDIVHRLREITSSLRGTARAFMDFGVHDATLIYCEFPDALLSFQREMLSTIQSYEPRLLNPQIVAVPSENLCVRIDIIASFVDDDGQLVRETFRALVHNDNDVTFR